MKYLLAALCVLLLGCTQQPQQLDGFAQCLTEKGAVMYGTDWCRFCQNQKAMFGASFKYIEYVNCDINRKACEEKNVEGYPTWYIGDKKLLGVQQLTKLAEETGCELPSS